MKLKTILMVLLISFIIFAQTESEKYSVNDINWMAGKWKGELFGGEGMEFYSDPVNGAMVGCFILPGEKNIFEFFIIREEEDGVYYKFKHFDGEMKAWEQEPLTYKLIELTENKAVFKSRLEYLHKPHLLIYKKEENEKLRVWIIGKNEDGSEDKFEVIYTKVN